MNDLSPFVVFGIVAAFALAMRLMRARTVRQANVAWQVVGERMGLRFSCEGNDAQLSGQLEGCRVLVERFLRSQGKTRVLATRIRVAGQIPPGVQVRPESAWQQVQKVWEGQDLQVGDDAFDGAVNLRGPAHHLRACLDYPTRRRVELAVSEGLRVEDGTILKEMNGAMDSVDELAQSIRRAVGLSRALSVDAPAITAALAANARRDPAPGVRRHCIEALLERAPTSDAATSAVRSALDDADERVRVLAARRSIGPEAQEALFALATSKDDEVCRAVAEGLATLADPRAEQALVQLLSRPADGVRCAAARSLGRVGSIAAVEPLLALTKGALFGGEAREAAREAVRRIQERLGDADAGRLSLAEPGGEGALSLAEPDGALSLAPRKPHKE